MSDHREMPDHGGAAGTKRKQEDLLAIVGELERRLPIVRSDAVAAAALADEVRKHILDTADGPATLPAPCVPTHQAGVRLWNLALALHRQSEAEAEADAALPSSSAPSASLLSAPSPYARLLRHARVFAFMTIHGSTWCGDGDGDNDEVPRQGRTLTRALYLLLIAVRTARSCIDESDTELGRTVLNMAAVYNDLLAQFVDEQPTGEDAIRHRHKYKMLLAELINLEMKQVWKENKPEAAEKLYADHKASTGSLDGPNAEAYAYTLLAIGKDLIPKREFEGAVTWLDRAREVVDAQGSPSDFIKALQTDVTHALAVASILMNTPEGYKRAKELAQILEVQLGEDDSRMHLVRLELYAAPSAEVFDATGYAQVLQRMIKSFGGSDHEFKLLHHHIQRLHTKSPGVGCDVLDEFLLSLRQRDATEWMERLVITRIWLLASQRDAQEGIDAAERVLSKLRVAISGDAAMAAQTLMWKRIEQGYQEKQYPTAMRWCRLALCHIFEAGGRANRSLIERKLLLCSIESNDLETAKATYAAMTESTQDETMTKYLLFKLAIRLKDLAMASDCLKNLSMSANGKELLYACVLHAKHVQAPHFTVQALKKLADTVNHSDADTIHTPALFRCTVLMLQGIIDAGMPGPNGDGDDVTAAVRDLSSVFEGVVEAIETSRNAGSERSNLFTVDEVEWFCRASYNMGLKYAGRLHLRSTANILVSCVKIVRLLSTGPDAAEIKSVTSKTLDCHFLIASAMSALAKRPDSLSGEEQIIKYYQVMREHIMAFQSELKQPGDAKEKGNTKETADLFRKLSILLIFDFEGAIGLGDWDELESICEKAVVCKDADIFRVFGDTLLRSQTQVPGQHFVSTMRSIIDKLRDVGGFGRGKLVKYYRCLFQAALYRDNDAAFQILEEVCHTLQADTVAAVASDESWPEDEVQFLAVTAFNEGVDWYGIGREDRARQWALLATSLASRCHDGGTLAAQITGQFSLLKLGDLEVQASVEEDLPDEAGPLSTGATDPGPS